MNLSRVTSDVLDLVTSISAQGPGKPEYDGLRVFQHPLRMRQHLTGHAASIAPVTLDVWPSLTCNARCPLCQYRISGARREVDETKRLSVLNRDLANQIFAGAAGMGVRSVILTGGGEPLLNPCVVELARSAREHGLRWGLITNGLLLTADVARDLLSQHPTFLRVSLDAGTSERRSMLYGTPADDFERVLRNVVSAARISRQLDIPAFGVSFALMAATPNEELMDIRNTIQHILAESEGGLRFVVFRPRLRHYAGVLPVCPQPCGKKFLELAEAIMQTIIEPIEAIVKGATKLDIKKGLFALAARDHMPKGCLSAAWMTTITHEGEGYITGELAGAEDFGQRWGKLAMASDFVDQWYGERRRHLHNGVVAGSIPVPIVHRTSPIDEFLQRLAAVTGGSVEDALVDEILQAVSEASWYRSGGSDFV